MNLHFVWVTEKKKKNSAKCLPMCKNAFREMFYLRLLQKAAVLPLCRDLLLQDQRRIN